MKIFITGASGFVGGAIAESLQDQHSIYAMARSDASADKIRARGWTPVRCALTEVKASDLDGCEVVIHSAAYVEAWGTLEQYRTANVDGTRQLLDVAREAGIRRFVHIGTEACLFHGQAMLDIDETYPYAEDSPYPYSSTKAAAEKLVLAANDVNGLQTVSVRPRMVWGPGDQTILPEVLDMIGKGSFVWVNGGKAVTATTHIANLVHGVRLALVSEQSGEAYFVTDSEPRTVREFLEGLLATQRVTPPTKSIPGFVLRPAAWLIESMWRIARIKRAPPITLFAADLLSADCTINTAKAEQELGYTPVMSVEDGMRQLTELHAQSEN